MSGEDFKPISAGDVTDLALLPGEFRAFRAEMRSAFELLTNRIMPALERIEQRQDEQDRRQDAFERETNKRFAALEARPKKKTKGKNMSDPTTAPEPTPTTSKAHAYEMWAGKLLAALLTALYATGAIPTSGPVAQVAGIAAVVLAYLGFAVMRTQQAMAAMHPDNIEVKRVDGGFARLGALVALALAGLVIMIAISGCFSSSQAKVGGKAAGSCAFSDLLQYGSDVKADLAKEDFWQALKDAAKQDNLTEEALVCVVQGVVAIEGGGSAGTLSTGQPSPVLVHGREFLAKHGKTAWLDETDPRVLADEMPVELLVILAAHPMPAAAPGATLDAAHWLASPVCESPHAEPAVDCKPFQAMRYDGCHWACQ